MKKYPKKLFALALAALLAVSLLAGCGASGASSAPASSAPASSAVSEAVSEAASEAASEAEAQTVKAAFTVTYADGTSENTVLEVADGTLLSDALRDAGLISAEEAAAGFVTVVSGVTADWDADGAWWCLTDGEGNMTSVGIDGISLHEGDSYAFTYTVG